MAQQQSQARLTALTLLLLAAIDATAQKRALPGLARPTPGNPLPWTVNASCLAKCETFCSNDTSCRAISFGRNFNHGLQCN